MGKQYQSHDEWFHIQLVELLSLCNELIRCDYSIDEFCFHAVCLGRTRLGFGRLRLLLETHPGILTGTYGIDNAGHLCNEQEFRPYSITYPPFRSVLAGEAGSLLRQEIPLFNQHGDVVGHGDEIVAALRNGDSVTGVLWADNLLSGQSITQQQRELLELYAAALGHLYAQQQAKEPLCRGEVSYRALLEQVPAIIYTDSLEYPGATLFVSRQIQTILHYFPEELVRQPYLWFRQLLHPDDRERVAAAFARCHATGEPLCIEYRMYTREGQLSGCAIPRCLSPRRMDNHCMSRVLPSTSPRKSWWRRCCASVNRPCMTSSVLRNN